MGRLIPQQEMSADDIMACASNVRAILNMIAATAWAIQNGTADVASSAESIEQMAKLGSELVDPISDALERHEGLKAVAA